MGINVNPLSSSFLQPTTQTKNQKLYQQYVAPKTFNAVINPAQRQAYNNNVVNIPMYRTAEQQSSGQYDPNSISTLRSIRAQGANVGDKRDFGGVLWRWNGKQWEAKNTGRSANNPKTFQEKTNPFISALRSIPIVDILSKSNIRKDLGNIGSGVGDLFKGNFGDSLDKLSRGITGTAGTAFTAAAALNPASAPLFNSLYSQTKTNPFEMGVSEAYASESTQTPQITTSSLTENKIGGTDPYKDAYSTPDKQNYLDTAETESRDFAQEIIDQTGTDDGTWGLELENLEQTRADILEGLTNQTLTDVEAKKLWAKQQKKLIEKAYGDLIDAQERGIPIAEDAFTKIKERQERLITEAGTDTEMANTKATNLSDEQVRNRFANQRSQEQQLGNIFSALGTAESSAFMGELGKVQRAGSQDVTKIEAQKADTVASNNRQYLQYKQQVNDKITDLEDQKNQQIQEIRDKINMTKNEKNEAMIGVAMQVQSRINELKNNLQNAAIEFANMEVMGRYNLMNTQLTNQGNIDALKTQYNLENSIPSIAQDEMPGSSKSGPAPINSTQQTLASQITNWFSGGGRTAAANQAYMDGLIKYNPQEVDFIKQYFSSLA